MTMTEIGAGALIVDLCVSTVIATTLLINGIINLFVFNKPKAIMTPDYDLPFISVLIPARNEEKVIERCVRSLLALNYPKFEVIVLDDNSSDSTYDILCRLRDQDMRLRTLAGAALPQGWCGKPHACWQLANSARGEYILMSDADCEFDPDALLFALGGLRGHNADVISLAPEYVNISFWEKLIIPLLVMIPIGFLPLGLVRRSRFPIFAAANGAFLFMKRDTYFELDGHRAVKNQLAEDVKFSQHIKKCGKTLWYGDGISVYRVRMYENLGEIWQGFTRNLFPAFSGKLQILVPTLLLLFITFVLPVVLWLYGAWIGAAWSAFALLPYILIVILRIGIAVILERDFVPYVLLNPVAWVIAITIAFGSILKNRKTGANWKGRVYVNSESLD